MLSHERGIELKRREFLGVLSAAAAGWPLAGYAQQGARRVRIGLLSVSGTISNAVFEAFFKEMGRLGYDDARVAYEFRTAAGDVTRLHALAAELVGMRADVIVSDGVSAARVLKEATGQIPIVMATIGDPIAQGIVGNLAHPGGNTPGFTTLSLDLSSKRLELLKEILPGVRRVGVLWSQVNSALPFAATQAASHQLGITIGSREAQNQESIAGAIEALVVMPESLFWNQRQVVIAHAAAHRLAAVYPEREYVDDGGLIAYGPNVAENFRRTAGYVDRILKGAKPADLPVQQPEKFVMIINIKSARAIGIDMPAALVARADEVIE